MDSGKVKRWQPMRIVLVISLALNLAVAGMVGGMLFSGRYGDGPPRQIDLGLGPVVRALSPHERRQVADGMRRDHGLRNVDMRQQRNMLIDALRAEPFDPAQLTAALEAQSAANQQLQSRAQEAFVAMVAAMSPARRAEFAAHIRAEMRGGPRGN